MRDSVGPQHPHGLAPCLGQTRSCLSRLYLTLQTHSASESAVRLCPPAGSAHFSGRPLTGSSSLLVLPQTSASLLISYWRRCVEISCSGYALLLVFFSVFAAYVSLLLAILKLRI